MLPQDEAWMRHALTLAKRAEEAGEVPVGAVLVLDNQLIAEGFNQPILSNDPSAHAEIVALRAAGQHLKNYRLPGTTLFVTLEPCMMCMGALFHARVDRLVFGAFIENSAQKTCLIPPRSVQGGVLEKECKDLLQNFFRDRRA